MLVRIHDVAEVLRESPVGGGVDALLGEEQHPVVVQARPDELDVGAGQGGHVETAHLGADRSGQRCDGHRGGFECRHRSSSNLFGGLG